MISRTLSYRALGDGARLPGRSQAGGGEVYGQGRPVQADPIKTMLKPPGTERLKLKCDDLLLKIWFQIRLAPLHQGARAAEDALHPVPALRAGDTDQREQDRGQ